jgi:phage FluMu protein Com
MVKRYQRGTQNLYIEEEHTTQWPTDTKGAIRICISKKNIQHNGKKTQMCYQNAYIEEEHTTQWSKDTKGAIRICILKKNIQHNVQKIPKV